MGSEWSLGKLGSVSKVRSGYAFKSSDMSDEGRPIIKIKNIVPPYVETHGCERIAEQIMANIQNIDRYAIDTGDILIAMTGATVGKVGRFPITHERFYLNQRVGKVYLTEPSRADYNYLYYVLSQDIYVRQMFVAADGSAQANISGTQIEHLDIPLPPLVEQRAIAHILGTLDDKIELNRQQNKTLEDMARALFKAWFVDFEPVRAKMEGRWQRGQSLPGLPADIFDLFPDRLVESELGEIPEGWEVRSVSDFADLTGGKQLEKEKITSFGDIPVFGGAGIMGYTDSHNADGFVIAVGRVGAYCGQFFSHRGKAWINNNASLIRHRKEDFCEWLLLSLRHADIDVIKKGAAQPFVSNGDIARLPTLWPGELLVQKFSLLVKTIFKLQEKAAGQSRTLAQLRDTLLPKLISGEVRVPSHFLKETK